MKSFTATDRDRGLRRLRRLTFGAVTGATMALLGISYVAAASYAGKASTASTTALNTSTSSATTSSSSSATENATASATASPTATTGNSGSGTVTSGGS